MNKSVNCYDLQMNFICQYISASEAERVTNICAQNIRNCCKGIRKTSGGYIWRYTDELCKERIS